jgi:hypothetical protein
MLRDGGGAETPVGRFTAKRLEIDNLEGDAAMNLYARCLYDENERSSEVLPGRDFVLWFAYQPCGESGAGAG